MPRVALGAASAWSWWLAREGKPAEAGVAAPATVAEGAGMAAAAAVAAADLAEAAVVAPAAPGAAVAAAAAVPGVATAAVVGAAPGQSRDSSGGSSNREHLRRENGKPFPSLSKTWVVNSAYQ